MGAPLGPETNLSSVKLTRMAGASGPGTNPFQPYPIYEEKLFRGACNNNPTGSFVILNIRTIDTELDGAAIRAIALQLRLGFTSTSGLSKHGEGSFQHRSPSAAVERLDLMAIPLCELSVANPGSNVRVSLHRMESRSFYAVVAQRVPNEHLNSALENVKAVAGKLFELKEEPHFRDAESQRFRTTLQ